MKPTLLRKLTKVPRKVKKDLKKPIGPGWRLTERVKRWMQRGVPH